MRALLWLQNIFNLIRLDRLYSIFPVGYGVTCSTFLCIYILHRPSYAIAVHTMLRFPVKHP